MIRRFTSAQFVPANAGAKAKNPVGSTLFSTPIIAFLRHSGHQILRTCCRESARKRLKKEAIIEHVARAALARIIGNNTLWPHFANTSALARFWALAVAERQQIWGDPIDPMDAVADFDPKYIHNGLLGAP